MPRKACHWASAGLVSIDSCDRTHGHAAVVTLRGFGQTTTARFRHDDESEALCRVQDCHAAARCQSVELVIDDLLDAVEDILAFAWW